MADWVKTAERPPPEGQNLIIWSRGFKGFGHAYFEDGRWFYGCEGFTSHEPPDFWMLPEPPSY